VNDSVKLIRSALPGTLWPAVPGPDGATALALQFQLERSQWLAPARLLELQLRQLDILLRHAHRTVPYCRERWAGVYDPGVPLTADAFAALPILSRQELQAHSEAMCSADPPAAHGKGGYARTSGSSGRPVKVLKSGLTELMWRAFGLREHLWHRRDFSGKLAAIRQGVPQGEAEGWGAATEALATGRSATLPVGTDVRTQLEWLKQQKPDYLLTHPTNLAELARQSLKCGIRVPGLREVRTRGEMLPRETRDLCRKAWGIPVTDVYSSNEVGYIALQCPDHEHYHVQSEGIMVEVLNAQGKACNPGEIGRIVVTLLHNFAMPLVRYEIGDYAEAGPPCSCGRGLPVLSRIMGRVRNVLILASGERFWPSFAAHDIDRIAPVLQYQFVQKDYGLVEARLVTAGPLTESQEEALRRHFLGRLPAGFELRLVYCDEIPRSAGGKFEYFVSEVAAPNR